MFKLNQLTEERKNKMVAALKNMDAEKAIGTINTLRGNIKCCDMVINGDTSSLKDEIANMGNDVALKVKSFLNSVINEYYAK